MARDRTGFMRGSLLLSWGMVTIRSPFFWSTKVQVTRSAFINFGSSWESSRFPEKKRIFSILQSAVFLSPDALEYSQERQAQKKADMQSKANAVDFAVEDRWYSCR